MNVDFQHTEIEIFDISPDGTISIEKDENGEIFLIGEDNINLLQPYQIEELKVIQKDKFIEFSNKEEKDYFISTIKEVTGQLPLPKGRGV